MYDTLLHIIPLLPIASLCYFICRRYADQRYCYFAQHTSFFVLLYLCVYLQARIGVYGSFPLPFINAFYCLALILCIPSCHILMGCFFGINTPNAVSWVMLRSSLFCIPMIVYDLINPSVDSLRIGGGFNTLNLAISPGLVFHIDLLTAMMAVQLLWLLARISNMYETVHRLQLTATHKGSAIVFLMTSVMTLAMLVDAISRQPFYTPAMALSLFFVQSVAISAWILIISQLNDVTIVRDSDCTPIHMDNDPVNALIPALRYLINDQKIYTRKGLRLDDIARELGTNRTYLSSAVHRTYGCSFPELLVWRRIEEAKRLLREAPALHVAEVAERCGFSSSSVFGKTFRESTGMTPREYRQG